METIIDRSYFKDKKRVVVKIGTSSITHPETGHVDLIKLEKFVRVLTDIRNRNKEVIVVSSGAVGAGRKALGIKERPRELAITQACSAVGQAQLMMIYQKLFAEYNQTIAQILVTRNVITNETTRANTQRTLEQLLKMGVIPILNENDAISTDEIQSDNFGDNDTLSAYVAELVGAELLILLTDIDGLYSDDPRSNENAVFINCVRTIDSELEEMAKGVKSDVGTGGMATKVAAAKIVLGAGIDMVIANGGRVYNVPDILEGVQIGTLFKA
ncbi:MAG: glutamate 5-kinase [Lachnospiraceae bacterium]|jgi:glutamate 5-kinase|nr:glutamate 5-kinase [Lachnospiraceae bacterium]